MKINMNRSIPLNFPTLYTWNRVNTKITLFIFHHLLHYNLLFKCFNTHFKIRLTSFLHTEKLTKNTTFCSGLCSIVAVLFAIS